MNLARPTHAYVGQYQVLVAHTHEGKRMEPFSIDIDILVLPWSFNGDVAPIYCSKNSKNHLALSTASADLSHFLVDGNRIALSFIYASPTWST